MAAKDLLFKVAILDETTDALKKIRDNIASVEGSVNTLQRTMSSIPNAFNTWASKISDFKMPDLTQFNEQVAQMGSVMGKMDASSIKSLKRVLKDIEKLQDDFSEKGLKVGFANLGQSMDKATGDMGKATIASLKEYKDKVISSLAEFKASLSSAMGTQGELNLFPSDDKWKSAQAAYQKLIRQTTDFYTALDRNMGDLGIISELARRIDDITTAVANVKKELRNQDILVDVKNNSNKSIDSIIAKIGELEARMSQFGNNGSFSGLTSFVSSLEEAVKKIHGQIESLSNVGGGNGTASAGPRSADGIGKTTQQRLVGTTAQPNSAEAMLPFNTTTGESMVIPFEKAQGRINKIIEDIIEKIRSLDNVEFNGNKIYQSANNLIENLKPLANSAEKAKSIAESVMLSSSLLAKVKTDLQAVSTEGGGKNGKKGDTIGDIIKRTVQNTGIVDSALTRLYNTYETVSKARSTILNNGGDVSNIDRFLNKLNDVRGALLEVRNSEEILSQKGTMLVPRDGKLGELATQLKSILNPTDANGASVKIEQFKNLMDVVKQLSTLTGGPFLGVTAQKNDFLSRAKEYETAAQRVKKALEDLADMRESIISKERASNTSGVGVSNLRALFDEISTLQKRLEGEPNSKTAASYLTRDYETLTKRVNEAVRAQQEAIDNKARLESRMTPLTQYISSAQDTLNKANSLGVSDGAVNRLQQAINLATRLKDDIGNLTSADWADNNKIGPMLTRYTDLRNTILNAASAVSTLNSKQESLNNQQTRKDEAQARKDAQAQMQSWGDATEKLSTYKHEIEKVSQLIKDMQDMNSRRGTTLDTSALERYLSILNEIYTKLQEINRNNIIGTAEFGKTRGGELYSSVVAPFEKNELKAGKLAVADSSHQLAQATHEEAQERKKAKQEAKEAAQANMELAQSHHSVAAAMENATRAGSHQSQVLSDLKSLAYQYVSVWAAQQFITDMANITGELQLQERSLEVILGNASAARQMYSQIRDLSQMSPYTFEDLLKSHRQLAAFGIEAKDIFGTLKSLSDIGAGLDVDVSRLILAYGHTKSYGYLSGIQNRQFETAGIDLVGALTEHYNKLAEAEKKAGNQAHFVTRADIFKRMRNRSIPFEDVQSVIMDLDRPGGKFYDMQIKQYETLGGKLRNLRNNYRIMQSEIGQSNEWLLGGAVNILNDITEKWRKYTRALWAVIAAYGAMKIAALVTGRAVVAGEKQITKNAFMRNRGFASTAYLNGQSSIWNAAGAGSRWSWITDRTNQSRITPLLKGLGTAKDIARSKELNNITKQRIALSNKLSEAQRYYILRSTGVDRATARNIATMDGSKRALKSLRLHFIGAAQAAKAFAVSMLTNPMTWVMAALAGLTALIFKTHEMSKAAAELGNNLGDAAKTNIEGIKQTLSEYEGIFDTNSSTALSSRGSDGSLAELHYINLKDADLQGRNFVDMLEELRKKLEAESPIYDGDFFNIMKAKSQTKQIEESFNTLKRLQYVNQVVDQTESDISGAIDAGHATLNPFSWGKGEDYLTNAKDYEGSYQKIKQSITLDDNAWSKLTREQQAKIEEYMKALGTTRKEAALAYLDNNNYDLHLGLKLGISQNQISSVLMDFEEVNKEARDTKRIGQTISDVFDKSFRDAKGRLDVQGASEYFGQVVNQMMTNAKVGPPEVVQKLSNEIAQTVFLAQRAAGHGADAETLKKNMYELIVGASVNKEIESKIAKGMAPAQADKIARDAVRRMINALKYRNKDFAEWWQKNMRNGIGKGFLGDIEGSAKQYTDKIRNALSWQLRMRHVYHLGINFDTDVDYADFIKKLRSDLKTAEDKLKSLSNNRLKWALNIDVVPNLDFKNPAAVKAFRRIVDAQRIFTAKDNARIIKKYNTTNTAKYSSADRAKALENNDKLEFLRDVLKTIDTDILPPMTALSGEHLTPTDESKKKSKGGSKSYQDPFAKRWDERIRIMKEAQQEYWKWEKEVGKDAAIRKVTDRYGDIFKEWKNDKILPFNFDVNKIEDIREYISKILKDATSRYSAQKNKKSYNYGEEALRVARTAAGAESEGDFEALTRAAEKWSSQESFYLDRLAKKWELYDKVRKATGSDAMAVRLSGLESADFGNQANSLRVDIIKKMEALGVKSSISFEDLLDMDDTAIEKKVQAMFGSTANAEKIRSIVSDLKKWRDIQKEINDESIEGYAELMGSLTTYASAVNKAYREYDDVHRKLLVDLNNGTISSSEFSSAEAIAFAKYNRAATEASPKYKNLIAGNTSYTPGALQKTGAEYIAQLKKQLEEGTISAEEYSEKLKKIQEAMDKLNDENTTSDFSVFINKGFGGLLERKLKRATDTQTRTAQTLEGARSGLNAAQLAYDIDPSAKNKARLDAAKARYDTAKGANDTADKEEGEARDRYRAYVQLDKAMDDAIKTMQEFQSALGLITNVLGSLGLGNSAIGKATQDMGTAMNGALSGASALSFLGPWGKAAGAALGLTGSIAQIHDNHLQRKIDALQRDVSKIEGYTQTISQAQARTLGYDTGRVLREYMAQYSAINSKNRAENAMASYYLSAGGSMDLSGYQQQYNLLMQKRQDYIDMYDAEAKKKKKSKKSLEEYKEKIADLDDKVRYFTQDMAKSLWDIDIKSWADQISDALMNAFENGENAAKAYNDSVRSILQNLTKKMLQMEVLEPMFKKLQEEIFGNGKDKKGVIDPNDVKGSAKRIAEVTADFFGENGYGAQQITAAQEYYNSMEGVYERAGLTLNNDSSTTLSSGISGTSEETADLLAGYINALRQDVAVLRLMQTQWVNEMWPDYISKITASSELLRNIDANIAAIRSTVSKNGDLFEQVSQLRDEFHAVVIGSKSLSIK